MKHYLLSIYQPDGPAPAPEFLAEVMERVGKFDAELKAAGAWVFSGGLHEASTSTVVRQRDDELLTTDGPFVEGKEHVGGVIVITAADLDAALEWARKASEATTLPIEVRPFQGLHEG
jgi:hypothetical protein